jgi:hypothetical protein
MPVGGADCGSETAPPPNSIAALASDACVSIIAALASTTSAARLITDVWVRDRLAKLRQSRTGTVRQPTLSGRVEPRDSASEVISFPAADCGVTSHARLLTGGGAKLFCVSSELTQLNGPIGSFRATAVSADR